MVFTLGLRRLRTLAAGAGFGRIFRSSDVARFVHGGVGKTFRCTTQSHRPQSTPLKFSVLFSQTAKLWPDLIDIADGELRDDDGGYFPTLNMIWNDAETNANSTGPWHGLMAWAQFCGLHKSACEALRNGGESVAFGDMDISYVKLKLLESLHSEDGDYGKMRQEFVDDAES